MTLEEYRTFVWLQKIGSPDFTFEQIKWLKAMQFVLTIDDNLIPKWDGKFHGEKSAVVS